MVGELFGDIGNPTLKVGGRIWHTAPLSILVHVVAIAGIVFVPSRAVDATRPPLEFAVVSVSSPLPPAPESPPPPPPSDPLPAQTPPPPPQTSSEGGRPATTFAFGRIDGIESQVPGGVAGGIVGGLVGAPLPPPPPVTPVRVGGRILPPTKLQDIAPLYPSEAALAGVQGIVILQATIGATGLIADVEVLRSIPLLDDAAVAAVRQWVYTPTLLNGVPVPVVLTVTVNFALLVREGTAGGV